MKIERRLVKNVARLLIGFLAMGAWLYLFRDDAHAAVTPQQQVGVGLSVEGSLVAKPKPFNGTGGTGGGHVPCAKTGLCGAKAEGSLNQKKLYAFHCYFPAAVANAGVNYKQYCKAQKASTIRNKGGLDPTLKFIYKCGGTAVIATWLVPEPPAALAGYGAAVACTWGSLFEGQPKALRAFRHKKYYRPGSIRHAV